VSGKAYKLLQHSRKSYITGEVGTSSPHKEDSTKLKGHRPGWASKSTQSNRTDRTRPEWKNGETGSPNWSKEIIRDQNFKQSS